MFLPYKASAVEAFGECVVGFYAVVEPEEPVSKNGLFRCYRLMFVFSIVNLISWMCHSISTRHSFVPIPHRPITNIAYFGWSINNYELKSNIFQKVDALLATGRNAKQQWKQGSIYFILGCLISIRGFALPFHAGGKPDQSFFRATLAATRMGSHTVAKGGA